MARVAIINTTHPANRGSMGRLEGMITCIRTTMPQIPVTVLHRYYKQDKDTFVKQLIEEHPTLEVKEHPWFRETSSNLLTAGESFARFWFSVSWHTLRNMLRKLGLTLGDDHQQYDVIIDPNLIEPDEGIYSSMTVGNFFALLNTWYATMTGKSVMVCSATIGPYKSRFLTRLASYVLNKVDMITLREEYSQNYLQVLGINKPRVYLSADLAFLLEPANSERISTILESSNLTPDDKPLVGIAPTAMMYPSLKQPQYIQLMAELTDFLIGDLNATVVYITHTYQDKPITENIYQRINNKHKVRVIADFSDTELKGIISMCDIFIASRFHALVASTSLTIPSIGIVAYSRGKFHGIIGKMMGQESYLLDVDDAFEYGIFLAELKSKTKDLWMNRNFIIENLKERAIIAKEQAVLNGRLIKELLDSSSPRGGDVN